tara:strand:- start:5688 stop:6524 length:837 start_codon:yes stop_codon:yes gene_type:complete
LLTKKHKNRATKSVTNCVPLKVAKSVWTCEHCGVEYKSRNGLWKHKKKCEYINEPEEEEEESEEEEAPSNSFVKIPKEVWDVVGPLIKNGTNNTNNTTNTNCNNTYNNNITVQVYLGEHCKDAKSIEHIVDELKRQVEYKLKDVAYASNLQLIKDAPADLFIDEIKKMPAEERPLHCADGKRGKFWVNKEKEGWVKEDVNEGGKLTESINSFKSKLYLDVNADINDKGKQGDVKYMAKKQEMYHELIEKKTVDHAIIAKLATECNIKDAIKDIEKVEE